MTSAAPTPLRAVPNRQTAAGVRASTSTSPTTDLDMTATIRSDAPDTQAQINLDCGLRDAVRAFERSYFTFHLANAEGSISQVAASSGMERTHLYRKLKTLGFDLRGPAPASSVLP